MGHASRSSRGTRASTRMSCSLREPSRRPDACANLVYEIRSRTRRPDLRCAALGSSQPRQSLTSSRGPILPPKRAVTGATTSMWGPTIRKRRPPGRSTPLPPTSPRANRSIASRCTRERPGCKPLARVQNLDQLDRDRLRHLSQILARHVACAEPTPRPDAGSPPVRSTPGEPPRKTAPDPGAALLERGQELISYSARVRNPGLHSPGHRGRRPSPSEEVDDVGSPDRKHRAHVEGRVSPACLAARPGHSHASGAAPHPRPRRPRCEPRQPRRRRPRRGRAPGTRSEGRARRPGPSRAAWEKSGAR